MGGVSLPHGIQRAASANQAGVNHIVAHKPTHISAVVVAICPGTLITCSKGGPISSHQGAARSVDIRAPVGAVVKEAAGSGDLLRGVDEGAAVDDIGPGDRTVRNRLAVA